MNPMFEIGHYVPQLAQLIIQSNLKINLKGIAVSRTWNIISEINLGKKNFLCQIILTYQNFKLKCKINFLTFFRFHFSLLILFSFISVF